MTLSVMAVPRHVVVLVALLAAAILTTAVLSLFGAPSWILFVLVPVPWLLVVSARRGLGIAVAAAVIASFWLLLMVMMLTTVTHLPMLGTVIVLWALVGLAGAFLCVRTTGAFRRPTITTMATWFPAALGGLIWLGAVLATNFIAGASRLSWVMLGDSANNILFAREIIYRGGVDLGPHSNPVPLPSAMMAIVMASGRNTVAAPGLIVHDITAYAQVWAIAIALLCLVVGATAASITRAAHARPVVVGVVAAGASLLPLSWFFTGYPIEFGFFNTHVALIVVMAVIVAYLATRQTPVLALSAQLLAATLLVAVWSPLVLLTAFLGLAIVIKHAQILVRARGYGLVVLLASMVQLLAYGLLVVLPGLLAQSGFLTAPGGAFGFRKWMIVVLAVVALVLVIATFRKLRHLVTVGILAIVFACAVGLGALLFVTRNTANPWSYYPLKFAWLGAVIITVLIVGLAGAFIARYFQARWLQAVGIVVVAAATIGFLNWAPSSGLGYVAKEPVSQLLSGGYFGHGDDVADEIFALANPKRANFLWQTHEEFEGSVNFWVMQMWSNSMSKNLALKHAAYGEYDSKNIKDLCSIVTLMGGRVTVHTAVRDLAAELHGACPTTASGVRVEQVK